MSMGSTSTLTWLLFGVFRKGRGGQEVRKEGKEIRQVVGVSKATISMAWLLAKRDKVVYGRRTQLTLRGAK